ncbi:MAG: hypothetical protein KF898_05370 [Parachlamydiales bacterium]|nr:hypothetical protein [Candidatus Acheromyda pituitae]
MSEAADAREGYGITRRFSEPSQCGVGEAALAANWSSAVAGESALAANGETSKIAKRIQRPMAWFLEQLLIVRLKT